MSIDKGSAGRLLLFCNDRFFPGMGLSSDGIFGILRGWNCPPTAYGRDHVHMRLRNVEHEVIFHYSEDGVNWKKLQHAYDASGFHHNALGGFLALRIGLDAAGEGEVRFSNWTYRRI